MAHITHVAHITLPYPTGYAGCALTARIPVKFGTAHGRSRPEVGNGFRIDANGRKGVSPFPRIFGTSDKKNYPPPPYCLFEAHTKLFLAYCL